jgi:LysM repeat protein
MQNVRIFLVTIFLFTGLCSRAQDAAIVQAYISQYKELAIEEMQRTGVPASIKLAQGIHETLAGTSDLVLKSNNHFGIKCKDTWKGESVRHDDDARAECFRKYGCSADSYRDHSNFLKGSPRYASLFRIDPLDYSAWAYGLKKAGYATNPKYPLIIIKLIEDYHLQDYTLVALGKGQLPEEIYAKSDEPKEKEAVPMAAVVRTETIGQVGPVEPVLQYPGGEFRINETKVIYAEKGTSFLSIAQQYRVPLSRLFEFNDMKETEALVKSQLIFLQRKRKSGTNEFHPVKTGETLYDIAQEEAIRIESLLEYNQLEINMRPAIGQQLYLRSKAPGRPVLARDEIVSAPIAKNNPEIITPVQSQNTRRDVVSYTVRPKETIYSISKKYNVTIDDLVQWNRLRSRNLKTGQKLKIYK